MGKHPKTIQQHLAWVVVAIWALWGATLLWAQQQFDLRQQSVATVEGEGVAT